MKYPSPCRASVVKLTNNDFTQTGLTNENHRVPALGTAV